MSTGKGDKEQLDLFSLKVRQKMENHRLPVDADCWERIDAEVSGRTRHVSWRAVGWMAAAAAVLALFLLVRLYGPVGGDTGVEKNPVAVYTESGEQEDVSTERGGDTDEAMKRRASQPMTEKWTARVRMERKVLPVVVVRLDTIAWGGPLEEETDVELPAKVPVSHHRMGPEPEDHRKVNLIAKADVPQRQGGKWQVGANMGSGGHMSLDLLDRSSDYAPNGGQNDPDGSHPSVVPIPKPDMGSGPESFSDVDCAPPLSFGLLIRKDLGGSLAVESGLVYTYLYSKMYENASFSRRATLGLHYLGIPVNLSVGLWEHSHWSVYLSGGFMVEKGIHSVYRHEAYWAAEHDSKTVRSGIRGLQWSLNVAVGISYRFYRNWSLYLEPRYSYYFDNGQPVSYRTENTTLIGLGAGVRLSF